MTYRRCRDADGQRIELGGGDGWASAVGTSTQARCLCSTKHGVEIVIDVTAAQCRRRCRAVNRTAGLPTTPSGLDDRRSGVLVSVCPLVIELSACRVVARSVSGVGGRRALMRRRASLTSDPVNVK